MIWGTKYKCQPGVDNELRLGMSKPPDSLLQQTFSTVQLHTMSHPHEKPWDQEASTDANGPTPEDASTELAFPDGGYRAWLTVAGGFLAQISSIGFLSAFSVFQSYYGQIMPSQSASNISWIGSLQIFG